MSRKRFRRRDSYAERRVRTYSTIDEFDGNLIKNDVSIQDMSAYINMASTDTTPYLLSTYDRYVALQKDRGKIIDRALNSGDALVEEVMKQISFKIVNHESSELKDIIKDMHLSMTENQFVSFLNEVKASYSDFQSVVNGEIDNMIRSSQMLISDGAKGKRATNAAIKRFQKQNKGVIPNEALIQASYSNTEFGDKIFHHLNEIGTILGRGEIHYNQLSRVADHYYDFDATLYSINQRLGTYTDIFANSKLFDADYSKRLNSFMYSSTKDMESRFVRNPIMKLGQNIVPPGMLVGVIASNFAAEYSNNLFNAFKNERVSGTVSADLIIDSFLNLKPFPNLTYDYSLEVNPKYKTKMNASLKMPKSSKAQQYYNTTFEFSFGDAYREMVKQSAGDKNLVLYRSMIMNVGMNEGYFLERKEREFLAKIYASSNTFKQASLDGSERYPIIISLNGNLIRFSEALRKFAEFDTVFTQGKVDLMSPQLFRGPTPRELYSNKLAAGAPNHYRIAGFAEEVPGLAQLVNSIENDYLHENKHRVRYRIKMN